MSLVNRKRPLDNESAIPSPNSAKRRQCSPSQIAAFSPSTISLLLALFPTMTDEVRKVIEKHASVSHAHLIPPSQAVIAVLSECRGDVDEAIKRLGHLSLAKAQQDEANSMHPQATSQLQPPPSVPHPPSTSPEQARGGGEPSPAPPPSTSSQEPRNPEEWVEGLVSEMAAATSMPDAR